jgi:hypothetical protein
MPWAKIAEGITICGMQQQWLTTSPPAKHKACYPDAYEVMIDKPPYDWNLQPSGIIRNLLALTGRDPEVSTALLDHKGRLIRFNAGAEIKSANISGDNLVAELDYPVGETSYILVVGVNEPGSILKNDVPLQFVAKLDRASEGWKYDGKKGYLFAKIVNNKPVVTLKITKLSAWETPVEVKRQPEEQKQAAPQVSAQDQAPVSEKPGAAWEFNGDDADGWQSQNELDALEVRGGTLSTSSTGGDPYMVSPQVEVDAGRYKTCVIRMKLKSGKNGQLFFITEDSPGYDEPKSKAFTLKPDNEFHEYLISMKGSKLWAGTVTGIRLDPCDMESDIEIDWIKITQ